MGIALGRGRKSNPYLEDAMPPYASTADRYLTHLVSAIDSLQHGERVTESVDRATFAVGMLHAVGMDDAAIGAKLRKEFNGGE